MTTQVQFRKGTTAEHAIFTGAVAEITVDTEKKTAVVHDGSDVGGFELQRARWETIASSGNAAHAGDVRDGARTYWDGWTGD